MVSRSDTKRRRKDGDTPAHIPRPTEESPKRAKVHAQRKFAQGSANMSSPVVTPAKDKAKTNGAVATSKLIPSNRPKTEDFLTFLCFRGTPILPPRLDFFNVATVPENIEDENCPSTSADCSKDSARNSRASSASISGSRQQRSNDRNSTDQVAGATRRNDRHDTEAKKKSGIAVQALRKKYQEQRLAKQRINTINKLAQKVKGKNMVRTRSSAHCEELGKSTESKVNSREIIPAKHRKNNKVNKNVARLLPRIPNMSKTKGKRRGLRSGGQLPAGSIEGLKSDRKIRQVFQKIVVQAKPKKSLVIGKSFVSSLSDFSSDDDQPLLKKPRMVGKNLSQRGQNMAQKVKKRYANQRPNKRARPQIMTRSRLQRTAVRDTRVREMKSKNLLEMEKERNEKEKKEKDLKDKEKKDKEIKEKEKRERERKEKEMVEKEKREKEQQEKEKKEQREREKKEKELKEKERKEKELKELERKEKELREKERRDKEQKEKRDRELKEKERKEREKKDKELKEKKERELKEKKEKEIKEKKERELKEKERKDKEIKEKREKEAKELKEKEKKEREWKEKEVKEREKKERELKEKEEKEKKERELKERKLKELKEKKEQEAQELLKKEKELREKEKEKRDKEIKEKKDKELKERKERELKEKEKRDIEIKEKKDKELREKEKKDKELREKEKKDKELREKEKKDKELREKEKKDKELREKEKRDELREKELLEKQVKDKEVKEREARIAANKEAETKEKDIEAKAKEAKEREMEDIATTNNSTVSARPTRKTKQAAAFYMELLGKSLIDPDFDDDDSYSSDSYAELPNTKRSEQRESEMKARAKETNWTPYSKNKSKVKTSNASKVKSSLSGKSKPKPKKEGITNVVKFTQDKNEKSKNSSNIKSVENPKNALNPTVTEDKGDEMDLEQGSVMPRRRSLRTSSFHGWETWDSSPEPPPRKAKSKITPKRTSDDYVTMSESFSDSDEEPLKKIAMRAQSTIVNVVEKFDTESQPEDSIPLSSLKELKPEEKKSSLSSSVRLKAKETPHPSSSRELKPEDTSSPNSSLGLKVKETLCQSTSRRLKPEENALPSTSKQVTSKDTALPYSSKKMISDEAKHAGIAGERKSEETTLPSSMKEMKPDETTPPSTSRGMKDALRESITHTPFKFRKSGEKSATKSIKNKYQVKETDVVERNSTMIKVDDQKSDIVERVNDEGIDPKMSGESEPLSSLPSHSLVSIVTELKSKKVETLVLDPLLDKLVLVNNIPTTSAHLEDSRLGRKATGGKTERCGTVSTTKICDIIDNTSVVDERPKVHDQRNPKSKVNMSTEQIEKWLNDSCLHDEEQRKQWELDKTTCQGRNNIMSEYLPTSLKNTHGIWNVANISNAATEQQNEEQICESDQYSYQLDKFKQTVLAKAMHLQQTLKSQESKALSKKAAPDCISKLPKTIVRDCSKVVPKRKWITKQSPSSASMGSPQGITSHKNIDAQKSSEKCESDADLVLISPKEVSPVTLSFTSQSEMGDSLGCDLRINTLLEDVPKDECKVSMDQLKPNPADRTPTKKSIFHRTRPFPHKIKERKDLQPSANAFSPENESSVYAFDNEPELPPMSKPFRRWPARDSRASSVATSRSEDDSVKLADVEMSPAFQYRPHTALKASQDVITSTSEEDLPKSIDKEVSMAKPVKVPQNPHKTVQTIQQYSYISKSMEDLPQLGDEELSALTYTNTLSQTPLKLSDLNSSSTSEEEDLAKLRERLLQESQQAFADQNRASNSIAVQVNLDTDDEVIPSAPEILVYQQSMECSTQTEEDDDDETGHLFYIPLQPGASGSNVTPSGMIQGVAVKLDQTGPNQRVIMRAKLVTKPPSFNRENLGRSLLGQPLRRQVNTLLNDTKNSVGTSCSNGTYPPVGTVQPTARAPPDTAQKPAQTSTVQPETPARLLPPDFSNITSIDHGTIISSHSNPSQASMTKQIPKAIIPEPAQKIVQSQSSMVRFQKSVEARPLAQDRTAIVQVTSGALPGSVKWALPNHHTSRRDAMTDSPSNYFVTPTPDKVLVAKKEAFISAVPPLAPLSYNVKKPVVSVTSKPVLKTTVMKPVQVQSPAIIVKASPEVSSLPVASKTPKTIQPPTQSVPNTRDNAVPGTSTSSSKPVAVPQKRGPKPNTKKWNMESAMQVCRISNMSTFPKPGSPAHLVEAPTFHPTEKEFQDPIEFIDKIRPVAEKFGLCRIVPPSNFKPECKVSDDMRFTAYNQYVHKTLHRWGPNVKEMMAIKKYLATQSIALTQPPWIGGMEIDLPRLYQTVQGLGGLKEVIEKKKWQRVADEMKITKSAQDRVTKLDDIYCKYLLPYETLSADERSKLFAEVESSWKEREAKVSSRGEVSTSADAADEESPDDDDDSEECIVKGRSMPLNQFYRIARNTMSMWFRQPEPPAPEVETEFWRHVTSRQSHVCVHAGSIESSRWGYGFPVSKNSPFARHPWNLKVLTNNNGSVLRSMGPIMGVTVPTLHVGMVFTTCCWYRDPHGLPWIEYLHTGASKVWYGIPDDYSSHFRTALTKLVPRYIQNKTIWLPSDTAMIPPPLLVSNGVSLSHTVQEPGQFVVVFPRAFTSTICTGYLVSESVYFAQPNWLTTAEQVFKDIHDSCEPSMFSLERLLFSIASDTRSNVEVLKQILPMVQNIREKELDLRKQLFALGLKTSDRLPLPEGNAKKRKMRPVQDDEIEYECEICRANLYISLVTNSHEEGVYCLPHAVELLSAKKHHLKFCKLLYTYDQAELTELIQKLGDRIEAKSIKKHGKQTLPSVK